MVKGTIKIPKDSQDCKDGKCGHPHEFPFEINDPKPPEPAQMTISQPAGQQMVAQVQEQPKQEEKKLTHEDMIDLMPDGLNAMTCPGGDCGHMKLKNKKQTTKWKECPNCTANTVPKGSEVCPYCTKNIDPDDLEDGLELESEEEED